MSRCNNIKNPRTSNGTDQPNRLPDELLPESVKIDDRSMAELFLYGQKLAGYINYYDENNEATGNWSTFFEQGDTALLALLATQNPATVESAFNKLLKTFATSHNDADLTPLLALLQQQLRHFNSWHQKIRHSPIRQLLQQLIHSKLQTPLHALIAIDKTISLTNNYTSFFGKVWNLDQASLESMPPNTGFDTKTLEKLYHQIQAAQQVVVNEAPAFFTQSLQRDDHPPHIGLLLAFVKLFHLAQKDLNALSKKHLDFYYQQVLQLKQQDAKADKVHLVFELAKNFTSELLKKGTLLKAGKDSSGKALTYELTEDLIVNQAKLSQIKSSYFDAVNGQIHFARVTNSSDGEGAELDKENPKWPAFGNKTFPKADIGFALASPVLWLQEGERTIETVITLKGAVSTISTKQLEDVFIIYLSGTKAWLGPYTVTPAISKDSDNKYRLRFSLSLNKDEEAVSYYDKDKLVEEYETLYPVMKVLLNKESKQNLLEPLLEQQMESVQIEARVNGIQSLQLENDHGMLDAAKPFNTFGSQPVKGSGFYIRYPEAFTKKLDQFTLDYQWQDVPSSNLKTYYGNHSSNSNLKYSIGTNTFKAKVSYYKKSGELGSQTKSLFNSTNNRSANKIQVTTSGFQQLIGAQTFDNLKVVKKLAPMAGNRLLKKMQVMPMMHIMPAISVLNHSFLLNLFGSNSKSKLDEGSIKLELLDDFFHKDYRLKMTKAVAEFSKGAATTLSLPKEPYTPTMHSLSLGYKASTDKVDFELATEKAYLAKDVELFHIGPFGQREMHPYLLNELDFVSSKSISLLPAFDNAGELYLGLENLKELQHISLLVQVADDSANPERDKEDISWSVLIDNHWKVLDSNFVLADTTNGFLQNGIVKISIPENTDTEHTYLPSGFTWLRASIDEHTDAVCQLIGIHPQSVVARFVDNNNNVNHLKSALAPKTISKLVSSQSAIKKLEQPYASENGYPKEDINAFYTRVSERLRHKNRSVNNWDYERIILQHFPEVYKVKCLNHTSSQSAWAPGHITLVTIPDLTNKNAFNKLEPKVGKGVLENIKTHVKGLCSPFINLHIINPDYEQIKLEFDVKFGDAYEFGFYKKKLNEDIVNFLSPWASGSRTDIQFGGSIHHSTLLYFIEKLNYVDFVTNFKMFHFAGENPSTTNTAEAVASNEKAILVSHPQHGIHNYSEKT